jgi:CRISPR-associated endonuclease/helicase Cas3
LSSQIIPKHRKPRIDTIKKYLDNKIPIILVSTQVVEAGVDLDFSIAIRDIGPIDSVVQTAGRCNRNGLRTKEESPFFIYRIVDENDSELAKKIYGRISIDIANELISKEMDLSRLLLHYYNEMKRRRSSSKSESIKNIIKSLNYDDIQREFNLIENNFRFPIFIEFDDEAEHILSSFIELSQQQRPTRSQMISTRHKMEHFMIGISEKDINRINPEIISGIYVMKRSQVNHFYDEMKGLVI